MRRAFDSGQDQEQLGDELSDARAGFASVVVKVQGRERERERERV